jgi:hypothetical protein
MAGSTNFQQWNPSGANQETDAAYMADAARSAGAVDGEVFDAETANKLFYQLSTGLTALMLAMAGKGFVTSDANLAQLVTVLANIQTTADLKAQLQVVPFGASLTFDCSQANGFQVTLGGNVTSMVVENAAPGQIVTFVLIQDATGGHTFAWPASMTGTAAIDPTANITNVQQFIARNDGTLRPISALAAN